MLISNPPDALIYFPTHIVQYTYTWAAGQALNILFLPKLDFNSNSCCVTNNFIFNFAFSMYMCVCMSVCVRVFECNHKVYMYVCASTFLDYGQKTKFMIFNVFLQYLAFMFQMFLVVYNIISSCNMHVYILNSQGNS